VLKDDLVGDVSPPDGRKHSGRRRQATAARPPVDRRPVRTHIPSNLRKMTPVSAPFAFLGIRRPTCRGFYVSGMADNSTMTAGASHRVATSVGKAPDNETEVASGSSSASSRRRQSAKRSKPTSSTRLLLAHPRPPSNSNVKAFQPHRRSFVPTQSIKQLWTPIPGSPSWE